MTYTNVTSVRRNPTYQASRKRSIHACTNKWHTHTTLLTPQARSTSEQIEGYTNVMEIRSRLQSIIQTPNRFRCKSDISTSKIEKFLGNRKQYPLFKSTVVVYNESIITQFSDPVLYTYRPIISTITNALSLLHIASKFPTKVMFAAVDLRICYIRNLSVRPFKNFSQPGSAKYRGFRQKSWNKNFEIRRNIPNVRRNIAGNFV